MKLLEMMMDPYPVRSALKKFMRGLEIGSYETRLRYSALPRTNYGYCVYNAAMLARKLGLSRISVLEYGVAGGAGLLNLEYHAEKVERLLGVEIDIYGFDTAEGLPTPIDYRDLPYQWKSGDFKMDVSKLQAKLKKAKLVLGNLDETAGSFFATYTPAPIGAISYDLDFYSSTRVALQMLDANEQYYLPRIYCYFDDIVGCTGEMHGDFTGERLAIEEFNASHDFVKLSVNYDLVCGKCVEPWQHKIRICHRFDHPLYCKPTNNQMAELPC